MILRGKKFIPVTLFPLIITIIPLFSQSPDLSAYIQAKYGYDYNIINGILYYDKYKQVLNHPFYPGEEFLSGSVVLSGITYENLRINYDIYAQHLVLEYPGISGGLYRIIVSPELTDSFDLDGDHFEKLTLDDRGPLFYQLISVNGLICYIFREKKMVTRSYQFRFYFTEPDQRLFLDYAGKVSPFSTRRNFVSLVSGVPKKEIKKYLRKNEIQISDATPAELLALLQFISASMQSNLGN